MASNEHIVRSFSKELHHLTDLISRMGGAAEAQLSAAITAATQRNAAAAEKVREGDRMVDDYERAIESEAIRFLALRQPFAQDLREIVSALKIAAELERIGDYAANVAKRTQAMAQLEPVRVMPTFARMGTLVLSILRDVMDAYSSRDVERAIAAWRRDEELDELYTSMFRELLTYMMEDPKTITACTHMLFMAKNIERIGDHATNIAETIHYIVRGTALQEDRPKNDESSFAIVTPDGFDTVDQGGSYQGEADKAGSGDKA